MYKPAMNWLQREGAIGIMPTDTVYGVVGRLADQAAVRRLYLLKSRQKKPGTIIAANIDQLVEAGIKRRYLKAVSQFWPGAVSVIVPVSADELSYVHQGLGTIAVRIPANKDLNMLLVQSGPLLTSSANLPGEPPADTIDQAKRYFGNGVDFYIDGGDLSGRQPSTIVQVVDDAWSIVRPGAVVINEANGRLI